MQLETEHFVKVLREIAQAEPKKAIREILRAHANNVDYTIQLFEGKPSMENLRHVVAAFARAHKAISMATPKVPDNPNGGVMTLEKMAA